MLALAPKVEPDNTPKHEEEHPGKCLPPASLAQPAHTLAEHWS